jgi:predicted 2-oxoglutarate/Fe(II)-dependent dioxygenase YbiX
MRVDYFTDVGVPVHAIGYDMIPDAACDYIKDWALENIDRLSVPNSNSAYNGLTIQYTAIDNAIVAQYMQSLRIQAQGMLMTLFNTEGYFSDGVMINRWPVGMQLGLHADNAFYPSCEPNYTAWRSHSAVFYLNDDFEGGEFHFGTTDGDTKVIKPVKNSLSVFSAGLESTHGVKIVTSGTRWTIPMWFTYDYKHSEQKRLAELRDGRVTAKGALSGRL